MRSLWIVCLLAGCGAKKSAESYGYAGAYVDVSLDEEADYMEAPSIEYSRKAEASRSSRPSSAPMAPPPPPPPPMVQAAPPAESAPEPEPEPDADAGRMVHYDGFAQIRTPRAEELVEAVIALTEAAEGEVQSRSLSRVSVRVPVKRFDAVWADVLALGPVVQRNLSADDVTDAFADMGLRLKSLTATRDRLVVLLAKASEPEEKLLLLEQIHRLSEQIEVMDAQLRTLGDLAAMSRITVQAIAPDLRAGATSALPWGMGWIDGLAAFDHRLVEAGRPVRLPVPEGFVRLDEKRFHVQAADGATVWAGTLSNDPQGTGAFWRQAVTDRIGTQLEDGATSEVGGWSLVRFTEPGAKEPYVWHLGFRVDGKHLEVLQMTYPTAEQEARYHAGVLAVLKGGEA